MNGEEWMEYLEAEESDLLGAEAVLNGTGRRRRKHTGKRISVLLAACMLLTACFAVAAAGTRHQTDSLASYFQVSDERAAELLARLELESAGAVQDAGYIMEVTEAASDGKSVYAVVTVTAPEGTVLDGELYALRMGVPWIMTDAEGNGYSCSGGGGINEMGRPGENQVAFLLEWDFHGNLKGKRLVLEITGIEEQSGDARQMLAEGNWTLILDVPRNRTKSRLQWTQVVEKGETYYVYKVEATPLGIHIYAVQMPGGKAGAVKEAFFELPVTVVCQDGSTKDVGGEASGGGGVFSEKVVHYAGGRLVDPEEVREVWLGETRLKL